MADTKPLPPVDVLDVVRQMPGDELNGLLEQLENLTGSGRSFLKVSLGVPLSVVSRAATREEASAEMNKDGIDDETQEAAHLKLRELMFKELEEAATGEDVEKLLKSLGTFNDDRDDLIGAALFKWVELCLTAEEAKRCFDQTRPYSSAERATVRKMAELLLSDQGK